MGRTSRGTTADGGHRALPRTRVRECDRRPDRRAGRPGPTDVFPLFRRQRDVLFADSDRLPEMLAEALRRADPALDTIRGVDPALAEVGAMLGAQVATHAVQRREVIARSPEVQERGRTKFAAVAHAIGTELIRRGTERVNCGASSGRRGFQSSGPASTDGLTASRRVTCPFASMDAAVGGGAGSPTMNLS